MTANAAWAEIPPSLRIVVVGLAVVQLAVEIFALVRLFRTPDERLVLGKKWPWVLIILFVNLVGAIVFLAAGRKPAPAADPLSHPAAANGDRAGRAADVLYGPKESDGQ